MDSLGNFRIFFKMENPKFTFALKYFSSFAAVKIGKKKSAGNHLLSK